MSAPTGSGERRSCLGPLVDGGKNGETSGTVLTSRSMSHPPKSFAWMLWSHVRRSPAFAPFFAKPWRDSSGPLDHFEDPS